MGAATSSTPPLVSFTDIEHYVLKQPASAKNVPCTLITTMAEPIITGTVAVKEEEDAVTSAPKDALIIVYGRNSCDTSVFRKYEQLRVLKYTNVAIYLGGAFEWCLLQDVYGAEAFPTAAACDLLKFAPTVSGI